MHAVTKPLPVDTAARRKVAQFLRDFIEGRISNTDLDTKYPQRSDDPAVHAVSQRTWRFQDDFREHRLTGRFALSEGERDLLERCVLFMDNDLPYEWLSPFPAAAHWIASRLGLRPRSSPDRVRGDRSAWPSCRQRELDAAKGAGEQRDRWRTP
ncbi:hypothetical protein GCM10012319_34790 [Comamonas sp. KCTC 72670]|nr:hypothetical protein GCM10012319_34790 [Comamonas sp. KCTC 72670]